MLELLILSVDREIFEEVVELHVVDPLIVEETIDDASLLMRNYFWDSLFDGTLDDVDSAIL